MPGKAGSRFQLRSECAHPVGNSPGEVPIDRFLDLEIAGAAGVPTATKLKT